MACASDIIDIVRDVMESTAMEQRAKEEGVKLTLRLEGSHDSLVFHIQVCLNFLVVAWLQVYRKGEFLGQSKVTTNTSLEAMSASFDDYTDTLCSSVRIQGLRCKQDVMLDGYDDTYVVERVKSAIFM